jgi:hypothetical protein
LGILKGPRVARELEKMYGQLYSAKSRVIPPETGAASLAKVPEAALIRGNPVREDDPMIGSR